MANLSIKSVMYGFISYIKSNPEALDWSVCVETKRYEGDSRLEVMGYRIDTATKRIILHGWHHHHEPTLNLPKPTELTIERKSAIDVIG